MGINLDCHRLVDQRDRHHNAAVILLPGHQPLQTSQGARSYPDPLSCLEKRMRFRSAAAHEAKSHCIDLGVVDYRGRAVTAKHLDHAGNAENLLPVAQYNPGEDIAREDGTVNENAAVFPAASRRNQGKKSLDRLELEPFCNCFFVTRLGGNGVPVRIGIAQFPARISFCKTCHPLETAARHAIWPDHIHFWKRFANVTYMPSRWKTWLSLSNLNTP